MLLSEIIEKAKKSFHGGGYGFYQSIGNTKGHRDTKERDMAVVGDMTHVLSRPPVVLDIGCNVGASLQLICEMFAGRGYGVDVDDTIIDCAIEIGKLAGSDVKLKAMNFATATEKEVKGFCGDRVDVILLFSVWDYFGVSSGVLNVSPDEANAISNIKLLSPSYIYFEGHADGDERIKNDVKGDRGMHDSWEKVFGKLGAKKWEFIGMMDNNRRPLFRLDMK